MTNIDYLKKLTASILDFENKFWKAKSAESFDNNLPAKSNDPAILIFRSAMNELRKTSSKSSAVQLARVERVLEINTDNQIKIIEKNFTFLSYCWCNCSFYRFIWNCLGYNEFFSINSNFKKHKFSNCCTWYCRSFICNCIGLLAAIPAVIAYNKFNSDTKNYVARLDNFSKRFLSII